MEHESFENLGVAKVMNEGFVCIKVDREERPDVDRVYMTFVQATIGGGGWPHERVADSGAKAIFRRHLFSAGGIHQSAGTNQHGLENRSRESDRSRR